MSPDGVSTREQYCAPLGNNLKKLLEAQASVWFFSMMMSTQICYEADELLDCSQRRGQSLGKSGFNLKDW